MTLEEDMLNLGQEVQNQYLKRMRDEFENRKNHKQLIEERKKYIENVFEDYEDNIYKYLIFPTRIFIV